jgi:hypothetical protein
MSLVDLNDLLGHAGKIVAGIELNSTLDEVRNAFQGSAICYEMVLDKRTFDDLLHVELPKLTEHLFAKRVPMLGAPHVVLTLWHHDKAHIFAADAFFDQLALGLAISQQELRARISRWRGEAGLPPDPWMRPHEPAPMRALLAPPPEKPN